MSSGQAHNVRVRVLVVEDHVVLANRIGEGLDKAGFAVDVVYDGAAALESTTSTDYDVIVLDRDLPAVHGDRVCRLLVRDGSPSRILMLTAAADVEDRVDGLELGADDYLGKPFSPRELLARLRAVLRRTELDPSKEHLNVGGVSLDVGARQVTVEGKVADLTGIEFDLLLALMRRAGRVVPRSSLLEHAGRSDVTVSDRTVDVHISHLRKKLLDDPPRLIKTVRGVGYVMAKGSE